MSGGRNNEVIDQFQAQCTGYPAKPPCRIDVGVAGRRVAGGMVVDEDEPFMLARQSLMHDMPGVEFHQAAVTVRSLIQMRNATLVIEE